MKIFLFQRTAFILGTGVVLNSHLAASAASSRSTKKGKQTNELLTPQDNGPSWHMIQAADSDAEEEEEEDYYDDHDNQQIHRFLKTNLKINCPETAIKARLPVWLT